MKKLSDYYKDKQVFITGITGFKGSWLALILYSMGAKVYGCGLKNEQLNSIFHKAKIEQIAKVYYVDITNKEKVDNMFTKLFSKCDYIFHLAAQSIVSEGYLQPYTTFNTNVMGTLNILELIKNVDKELTFVNITTDKVYQPSTNAHIETDVLQGEDPYSLSKSFSDMLSEMYQNVYLKDENIKVYNIRGGNVIGGGDYAKDRIVPTLIHSLENDKVLQLRCPKAIRPYQFVLDCLYSYLLISCKGKFFAYNVGPTKETLVSTENLVKSFQKHTKRKIEYGNSGYFIGNENQVLTLNTELFINEFNLLPFANNIDEITKYTLEWYNRIYKENDMQAFSLEQIKKFGGYYDRTL